MGAGVDSMMGSDGSGDGSSGGGADGSGAAPSPPQPLLPRHLPLLRVVDPLMSERMATWVLWGVINCQRRCDAYLAAQRQRRWAKDVEHFRNIDNAELRVGILGLGECEAFSPARPWWL